MLVPHEPQQKFSNAAGKVCEIARGSTDSHLPHASTQGGSNTIFTHTRSNWVAAEDAVVKLKEIAAIEFSGNVEDYSIGNERVFKTEDANQGLSYGEAAAKAVELGRRFSGEEYPDDIHPITQRAVPGNRRIRFSGCCKR